jgi:hypothetical protein
MTSPLPSYSGLARVYCVSYGSNEKARCWTRRVRRVSERHDVKSRTNGRTEGQGILTAAPQDMYRRQAEWEGMSSWNRWMFSVTSVGPVALTLVQKCSFPSLSRMAPCVFLVGSGNLFLCSVSHQVSAVTCAFRYVKSQARWRTPLIQTVTQFHFCLCCWSSG